MRDGFSLSNVTRIARASGSNFWVGAVIGAGADLAEEGRHAVSRELGLGVDVAAGSRLALRLSSPSWNRKTIRP